MERMTLEQMIAKLDGITAWQKRAYREYRQVKIEYRILIALLFLSAVINLLIFLRLGGIL
jgi:hypothetical protein